MFLPPSSDLSGGKILRQILLFVRAEEAKIPLIVNHALHINFFTDNFTIHIIIKYHHYITIAMTSIYKLKIKLFVEALVKVE